MPDWAYYQQNGKSATMNLYEQTKKIKERALLEEQKRKEAQKQKQEEKEIQKQIEKQINEGIEKALTDILGNLAKQ
jgi:TfoX/Sxy family transcriptional regulator of competence genes